MTRTLVVGNSGSGKSTLAARLAAREGLAHRGYETRSDELSLSAHRQLFERFVGDKVELTSREAIAATV